MITSSDAAGETSPGWDAATYDKVANPHVRWGRAVLDRLRLAGDEVVLDAGCGTGRVTEVLLDSFPSVRVIGLDASPDMVARAGERLAGYADRISLVVGDLLEPLLAQLPAGWSGPVDAVLSTATFHWVHDHDRLFANLAAALRPGGQLVAQCGGAGNIAAVQAAVVELGGGVDDTYFEGPSETEARLAGAGFTDVSCWLQPEPTGFASLAELETFLATVVLR
ncbi:MAG: class I SAM-dependent methyltransferase, partial [Acidimicrobiales bacterium]